MRRGGRVWIAARSVPGPCPVGAAPVTELPPGKPRGHASEYHGPTRACALPGRLEVPTWRSAGKGGATSASAHTSAGRAWVCPAQRTGAIGFGRPSRPRGERGPRRAGPGRRLTLMPWRHPHRRELGETMNNRKCRWDFQAMHRQASTAMTSGRNPDGRYPPRAGTACDRIPTAPRADAASS